MIFTMCKVSQQIKFNLKKAIWIKKDEMYFFKPNLMMNPTHIKKRTGFEDNITFSKICDRIEYLKIYHNAQYFFDEFSPDSKQLEHPYP